MCDLGIVSNLQVEASHQQFSIKFYLVLYDLSIYKLMVWY